MSAIVYRFDAGCLGSYDRASPGRNPGMSRESMASNAGRENDCDARTTARGGASMQIGINRWTMPPDWEVDRCLREARAAGFETIELNMAEEGYLTPSTPEAQVRRLGQTARDLGIGTPSLSNGLGWAYPLTSADAEVRARGKELLRALLRIAAWIGADTVLCVPGGVTPEVSYDVAYRRAQEALTELAEDAAAAGVVIGVENVWNKFLLSPMEMARFVDEIGSPYVQAYFDAGNVLVFGYPQHWIRILGKRIKKVHVKDFRTGIGNITAFCNPLQGDLPWAEVRAALDEVGYAGPVTAEVDGYRVHPELGLKHVAEALAAVFK
jgi:hexulose-6-phosphate isomerase